MRRSATVFVTLAFAVAFIHTAGSGFEAIEQNEEEPHKPNTRVIVAEELAAMVGGAILGAPIFEVGFYGFWTSVAGGFLEGWDARRPELVAAAAGYGLGFPVGAAAGVAAVGAVARQRGSFVWSWAGAQLGVISAAALAFILSNTPLGWLAEPSLSIGPVAGAVIGYNLSRSRREGSSSTCSGRHGSRLSLLAAEVEVRGHRLPTSFQEPTRNSSPLTYQVTLARLTF